MSRLEEIERQVRALPPDELAQFREWFFRFAADDWDRQIAADLQAGRLDDLLEEARNDLEAGRFREL
jgi:hypothetical protein